MISNKQLCLERDAFRCRVCGVSENLEARKLITRSNDVSYHLSNLITLCSDCNNKKENLENSADKNYLGVILCGGRGSRLYPLTKHTNKHLLPIGIVPMVFYPIKTLQKMGVKRVVIVIDQFSYNITDVIGSGKAFGMEFSYKVQDGAFGIADALYLAKEHATREDKVICILGDNIFNNNSLDFNFDEPNKAYVYIKKVNNPQDYGVARVDGNKIIEIVEKPKKFISDLAVVGLYVYPNDVFEVIPQIDPSPRGETEISSINNFYVRNNRAEFKEVTNYWGDAGSSIQRYAECSMHGAKEANVSSQEIDSFRSIVFDNK